MCVLFSEVPIELKGTNNCFMAECQEAPGQI